MKQFFKHGFIMGCLMCAAIYLFSVIPAYADEYATPILEINGTTVCDGSYVFEDRLPAGVTFDRASYTVTLNNASINVPADQEFIDGLSYGGTQTYDLHIVLQGTNTITCADSLEDDMSNTDLFHNNGNMIIEGSGSLTVKNNMGTFAELHDSDKRDLTIKDCTINCAFGYKAWELLDVNTLTLDGCTLNTDYSTEPGKMYSNHDGRSRLAGMSDRLVMKNAVWNVKTSGGGSAADGASIRVKNGGEFHNSVLKVTGDYFYQISFGLGDVVFDNASFLGRGEFSGINYDQEKTRYTYFNFTNKHQYVYEGETIDTYSGRYAAADLMPRFEIIPYTEKAQTPGENKETSVEAVLVNKKPVTSVKITAPSRKIAAGKSVQLKVKVLPDNADNKEVTWSVSNKKVAKVSASGKVTLLKKTGGKKVTITATAKDGSGKKGTITITSMKGVVKKVRITGKKSVKAGKSVTLKAVVTATKGACKTVQWTSGNKKYATVNSKGTVKALKAGKGKTVKITAKALDGSNKKAVFKLKIK